MRKFNILDIDISVGEKDKLLNSLINASKKRLLKTVAPIAIHPLVMAYFDKDYKKILKNIDYVLPDSYWHLWGINFLYKEKIKKRFYGPDFMRDLCILCKKEGVKVFLYGGKNSLVLDKLAKWYKELGEGEGEIHKFTASFSIDDKEINKLAKNINNLGRGILFIGLSSPLQHEILNKLEGKVRVPVVAVGAAFNLLTGMEKQAPEFIRLRSFEWLFRLVQNPRRLLRRYLFSLLFFPLIFKQRFKLLF